MGQTVSGSLHFTLSEAKSYKFIKITLYGGARVLWTETYTTGSGQYQQTHTVTYHSQETYVNQDVVLWSSEQSADGQIEPGTYNFPFQFLLPPNCLGTFQGSVGRISYALQGHIKTGLLHRDHNVELPIQVNRMTDVNTPQLMVPTNQSIQKEVGCFCCGSTVELTVSLTRTGFCIGHGLPLTANVVNGSSRRIKMRVSIQRICTYHAQGHASYEKRKVAVVVSPQIPAHSQYTWNVENLVVPMVEPSFEDSAIIKMQYTLKVTAVIPWAKNTSVSFPIALGNVPLNNTVT